jgi:hypothetical protein
MLTLVACPDCRYRGLIAAHTLPRMLACNQCGGRHWHELPPNRRDAVLTRIRAAKAVARAKGRAAAGNRPRPNARQQRFPGKRNANGERSAGGQGV